MHSEVRNTQAKRRHDLRWPIVTFFILITFGIVIALGGHFARDKSLAPAAPPTVPPETAKAVARTSENERAPVAVASAKDAAATVVVVRSDDGMPIAHAGVFVDDISRRHSLGGPDCLAETDSEGSAQLDLSAAKARVMVGCRTYLSVGLELERGKKHVVTLKRGAVVELICLDQESGSPLAGVHAVMSQGEIPQNWWPNRKPEVDDEVPDTRNAKQLFHGVSGKDGRIAISGLAPCVPTWRAILPGYALTEGPAITPTSTAGMAVPGSYTLKFTPLMACGYLVKGDNQIWMSGGLDHQENQYFAGLAAHHAALMREQLATQFPGARLFVLPVIKPLTPMKFQFKLQLERVGEYELELPLLSIADFERSGPVVIDTGSLAAKPRRPLGQLRIELVNGNGSKLSNCGLLLKQIDGDTLLSIRSDASNWLPPGRYSIAGTQQSLTSSLPNPCIVEVIEQKQAAIPPQTGPQIEQVRLGRTLHKVRVEHKGKGNFLFARRAESTAQLNVQIESPEALELLLPQGLFLLSTDLLEAAGVKPVQIDLDASDGNRQVSLGSEAR